jgi:hypothetical protein
MFIVQLLVLLPIAFAFQSKVSCLNTKIMNKSILNSKTMKLYGARNRAWAKGDLSDKDIFEDDVSEGKDITTIYDCDMYILIPIVDHSFRWYNEKRER